MLLALAHNLGAKGGLGALSQLSIVVLEDVQLLLDFLDPAHGNITSLLETISDFEGVDAFIQKFLGLFEDGTGKHDDTCSAITDLVVLRRGQLSQKAGRLVMNLQQERPMLTLVFDFDFAVSCYRHIGTELF